jgi:hypothetical protein
VKDPVFILDSGERWKPVAVEETLSLARVTPGNRRRFLAGEPVSRGKK